MSCTLLIAVRFHDGRYHGAGDWPPSPARFFQALVAGAAIVDTLADKDKSALAWLEKLDPPHIATPLACRGKRFSNYVPNNDLDKELKLKEHGWNIDKAVAVIRAAKIIHPWLFDSRMPFLYAWEFGEDDVGINHARVVCGIAEQLYQFGRGVDMAWAWGEILEVQEMEKRLADYGGTVYRPMQIASGTELPCPMEGSLKSLIERHNGSRKQGKQVFQPLQPRFSQIAYNSPSRQYLFDLRNKDNDLLFISHQITGIASLVANIRDAATARLSQSRPEAEVRRVFIGRRSANEADKALRLQIIPLPSIGHPHADRAIRRVLINIPSNCPIPINDINWSLAGLDLDIDYKTDKELCKSGSILLPAEDKRMLQHYGIGEKANPSRLWRTVTPVALPCSTVRSSGRGKGARQRIAEENQAICATVQALRHCGVAAKVQLICVQREPFAVKGMRAEDFSHQPRFHASRMWHVELTLTEAIRGPLVIGDGRYFGLGLMAPVQQRSHGVLTYTLPSAVRIALNNRSEFLLAVRRALMSLARDSDGNVNRLFSGHETDGSPARSGRHEHFFLAIHDVDGDGYIDRLVIAAPWICDRSDDLNVNKSDFDRIVFSLHRLKAGRLGIIDLGRPVPLDLGDSLIGPGQVWESHTLYQPTRHAGRGQNLADAVLRDIVVECLRRGLPKPEVELLELEVGPKGGTPKAQLRLHFDVTVPGPLMLGRDSHMGGGLFSVIEDSII